MVLVLLFDKTTKSVTKHNTTHLFILFLLCVSNYKIVDVETGFHIFYIHFDTYSKSDELLRFAIDGQMVQYGIDCVIR